MFAKNEPHNNVEKMNFILNDKNLITVIAMLLYYNIRVISFPSQLISLWVYVTYCLSIGLCNSMEAHMPAARTKLFLVIS